MKSYWTWEVDKSGVYTYVSPEVEAILGYSPEEIIGKTPFELMPHEESVRISEVYQNIAENNEPIVALENINHSKHGSYILMETNGIPIFNKTGKLTHYKGIDRDIRYGKKAEAAREKLFKALQEKLENVKTLSGLLPICAKCKKIRDDKGYWNQIESYIEKHTYAKFTHGTCPDCSEALDGNQNWYIERKKNKPTKQ